MQTVLLLDIVKLINCVACTIYHLNLQNITATGFFLTFVFLDHRFKGKCSVCGANFDVFESSYQIRFLLAFNCTFSVGVKT